MPTDSRKRPEHILQFQNKNTTVKNVVFEHNNNVTIYSILQHHILLGKQDSQVYLEARRPLPKNKNNIKNINPFQNAFQKG